MLRVLVFALALFSSVAMAQTQTTDCVRDYWGNYKCTSQQQGGVNWGVLQQSPPPDPGKSFMEGFERGQRMRTEREQERLLAEQRKAQSVRAAEVEKANSETATASKMIQNGDCDGAKAYALSVGNLVLAKQVKDYCGG